MTFSAEESRHIARSMRVRKGDVVRASDGQGTVFRIRIRSTGRYVGGEIIEAVTLPAESLVIRVGVGLARRERFRWLVEKLTELGVREITPLATLRFPVHARGASGGSLTGRLRQVAVGALKQSKRTHLPVISRTTPLSEFLEQDRAGGVRILLDERAGRMPVGDAIGMDGDPEYTVLLGPEGGFTDEERDAAIRCGFEPVSLGRARLRVETAAVAAVAAIRALRNQW